MLNTQERIEHLSKYFKKHQRDVLFDLYYEHAVYLARAVKTAVEKKSLNLQKFLKNVEAWEKVATCHEVAINRSQQLFELATHQNRLGKEFEYTHHAKAKNISRDVRVKLIWNYLYEILTTQYDSLMIYKKFAEINDQQHYYCPFCSEIFFRYERVYYDNHLDNTHNWNYQYRYEAGEHEDHLIYLEMYDNDDEIDLDALLEHFQCDLEDLLKRSKIDYYSIDFEDMPYDFSQSRSGVYVADIYDFTAFLVELQQTMKHLEECRCNLCQTHFDELEED